MPVLLPAAGSDGKSVRVHPVALFSICDAYLRRSEKQERVIGTLLGVEVERNVLEVKSCYVVPHTESSEQVGACLCVLGREGVRWRLACKPVCVQPCCFSTHCTHACCVCDSRHTWLATHCVKSCLHGCTHGLSCKRTHSHTHPTTGGC